VNKHEPFPTNGCCGGAGDCVFAKALQARVATCGNALRRQRGEREVIDCAAPVAHTNCMTFAALLHERARFALRLPGTGQPMMHAQALRLYCGGVVALQRCLDAARPDVHAMVGTARERFGGLSGLPWPQLVRELAAWRGRRPRPPVRR
jgi:hypothetical protein